MKHEKKAKEKKKKKKERKKRKPNEKNPEQALVLPYKVAITPHTER
jgi:hypothetical protein